MRLRPGDRVVHPAKGPGEVVGLRPGQRARVRFDDDPGLPRTFPVDELVVEAWAGWDGGEEQEAIHAAARAAREEEERFARAVEHAAAAQALLEFESEPIEVPPWPAAAAVEDDPERLASLRQTIEALRLGVVPAEHVREYTVARGPQLARLEELFDAQRGLEILWGDYGAGKTHLLDIAEQLGLEAGYVTARIVLDPHEVPPTHPKRLYSAILEHLRYPDGLAHGLEPLCQRLVGSREHARSDGDEASRFYSAFVYALERGDPDLLDWMRDYVDGCFMDVPQGNRLLQKHGWSGGRLLTLSDFRTYGRMYVHMLGTVASWSRDAGFRGLLLLFDEVEFVESIPQRELEFALEVLRHFAAVTLPRPELGFDPEALYRGGQEVHREIPMRFREDQPLVCVFALTPLEAIREMLRAIVPDTARDVLIPPLGPGDAEELVLKVRALYQRTYPGFVPTPADLETLHRDHRRRQREGGDSPREIVRATVQHLDRARVWSARSPARSLDGT